MRFFSPTAEFTVRDGETRVKRLADFSLRHMTRQRVLKSPHNAELESLIAYLDISMSKWEIQWDRITRFRSQLEEAGFSISRERVFVPEREGLLLYGGGLEPIYFMCRCAIARPEEDTNLIQEICFAYEAKLAYEPKHWQSRNGNYAWQVERSYPDLFSARSHFGALVTSLAELTEDKRLDFGLHYVIRDVNPENEDQKWLAPQ